MAFQDLAHYHLAQYKAQKMRVSMVKGKRHPHILPKELKKLNIFEPYRTDFFNYQGSDRWLNMYFHHLNSSQAVCFNFFYPFIHEKRLDIIAKMFGVQANDFTCEFEKVIDPKENTHFDYVLETSQGQTLYFEIKYTENEWYCSQ